MIYAPNMRLSLTYVGCGLSTVVSAIPQIIEGPGAVSCQVGRDCALYLDFSLPSRHTPISRDLTSGRTLFSHQPYW